jgi:hypothetical protein
MLMLACSPLRVPAASNATSVNVTKPIPSVPLAGDSVILPFQPSNARLFHLAGPLQPTSLSKRELLQLDSLLLLVQQEHQLSLQRHYRQYIGVLDSIGQKTVWVNALCRIYDSEEYWKKDIYQVKGGGACYWSVQINLTTAQSSYFSKNAPK